MTPDEAIELAKETFPNAPREIAAALGVEIRKGKITGTDGWCLRQGSSAIIMVNEGMPRSRQRFTIAHELSHLLLGTEPEVLGQMRLPFASARREERQADTLASDILLPIEIVLNNQPSPPVCSGAIKKLAKLARVSEHVVCCRITGATQKLGLLSAASFFFKGEQYSSWYSDTLSVRQPSKFGVALLKEAKKCSPMLARVPREDDQLVTAALAGSPMFPVVFAQLLPKSVGLKQSLHEESRRLREQFYENMPDTFRSSFEGTLGAFRRKAEMMNLEDATKLFKKRCEDKWEGSEMLPRVRSKIGEAYIKARLREFCC